MRVAIIGASGYTGGELMRLLLNHPETEVAVATSRTLAGTPVTKEHPHISGFTNLHFTNPSVSDIDADFAFLAVPHTAAMQFAPSLLERGLKVVDLSADYRLPQKVFEEVYGVPHTAFFSAPYGLPELHRREVKNSRFVANPGCFPTGATLAAAPLAKDADAIIFDSKTGVSGAGDNPSATTHYPNVGDNVNPYKWTTHRHLAEMKQEINGLGGTALCYFTPHLVPVNRGILTTAHILLKESMGQDEVERKYKDFYREEFFIRLQMPRLSAVRGTNFCDIQTESEGRRVVAVSAIDNLMKGASGQAVQNMNIMCGWKENTGLLLPGLLP